MISRNRGESLRISSHLSHHRKSPGNTQFLLYGTSGPKWVENHGETAVIMNVRLRGKEVSNWDSTYVRYNLSRQVLGYKLDLPERQ